MSSNQHWLDKTPWQGNVILAIMILVVEFQLILLIMRLIEGDYPWI